MLRSALALLSSLQIGLRIKESVERSLRQAVVIAVAVVVLIAAAAFGLLAAYQALILSYGFTPAEAAGIIAAALAPARRPHPRHAAPLRAEAEAAERRA